MKEKLKTLHVEARVFEDGMLGVKLPADLEPGVYNAVLVIGSRQEEMAHARMGQDGPIEPLAEFLEKARTVHIQRALDACGGNRTQTAKLLGVDVRTVFRVLAKDHEDGE